MTSNLFFVVPGFSQESFFRTEKCLLQFRVASQLFFFSTAVRALGFLQSRPLERCAHAR
jgi:hypothetical protein